jgi:hypothetical protein
MSKVDTGLREKYQDYPVIKLSLSHVYPGHNTIPYRVKRYAKLLKQGSDAPPIEVMENYSIENRTAQLYEVQNGQHRYQAAVNVGRHTIDAVIIGAWMDGEPVSYSREISIMKSKKYQQAITMELWKHICEKRSKRAAKRLGLIMKKSSHGFMLLDPKTKQIVTRDQLSTEDIQNIAGRASVVGLQQTLQEYMAA